MLLERTVIAVANLSDDDYGSLFVAIGFALVILVSIYTIFFDVGILLDVGLNLLSGLPGPFPGPLAAPSPAPPFMSAAYRQRSHKKNMASRLSLSQHSTYPSTTHTHVLCKTEHLW